VVPKPPNRLNVPRLKSCITCRGCEKTARGGYATFFGPTGNAGNSGLSLLIMLAIVRGRITCLMNIEHDWLSQEQHFSSSYNTINRWSVCPTMWIDL